MLLDVARLARRGPVVGSSVWDEWWARSSPVLSRGWTQGGDDNDDEIKVMSMRMRKTK